MKQLIHSLEDGETKISEIPSPSLKPGELLIISNCSLISTGTEKMLVEFGKANLLEKVLQQPDKFKQVIDKIKSDGPIPTLNAVQRKLKQPIPLGYSNVGKVIGVGSNVSDFKVGDRVVSNGSHAEIVAISSNLCAKIPDNVDDISAAFTVLGSIGLQGLRLANPTFGETFLVSGLGLIGLITAQLLKANGCHVLGLDPDPKKCSLADSLGIKSKKIENDVESINWIIENTLGRGIDGALITASTVSNQPINFAAKACRKRGRIILIGVTGMKFKRDLFYKKELTFQVSCSYGPGRYDKNYENKQMDYPIGFVRWTEKRNFEAILNAIANGQINTNKLISHKFSIDQSPEAYKLLSKKSETLGILIEYPKNNIQKINQTINFKNKISKKTSKIKSRICFIGTGNYASTTLLPAFAKTKSEFVCISSNDGLNPLILGKKYKFNQCTTNNTKVFNNNCSNTIVIATRHESHAELVIKGLIAKKNIFVEKPLCITRDELTKIQKIYFDNFDNNSSKPILMVGFNRRFSPITDDLKRILRKINNQKIFIFTCNAGKIDGDHWLQEDSEGGRLLGECCHFVDLLRYLADSPIKKISLNNSDNVLFKDNFTVNLEFKNGDLGTVHYFSNGDRSFPKERLEVISGGSIIKLDNFKKIKTWGIKNPKKYFFQTQNKGQNECVSKFVNAVKYCKNSPIPIEEIFEVQNALLSLIDK